MSYLGKLMYMKEHVVWPRWRYRQTHCAFSHNQKKDNNNLKTQNNQNWQKIELYRSLTTKELKKTHSSRPVGGADIGSQVEKTKR